MLLTEAITLITRLIDKEETHQDYTRTVELAEKYKAMITGCDIEKQLIQVVQREDAALFAQRVRLTKSITPAVAASIRRPFSKVTRNDRVKKKITLEVESRVQTVNEMIGSFFGAKRKKNKGLEYWIRTRFLELQFSDPNAWIVLEWTAPENPGDKVYPRPFEVSSRQARNFLVVNDDIKWLFVCQAITYLEGDGDAVKEKSGLRWTLYDEDVTVVFEQIDKEYFKKQTAGTAEADFIKIKDATYYVQDFVPNLGFVPAVRIGYNRDEETDGRTFVNPWHAGLCFFEKMLVTVSELDLTLALHTFPQKIQYVQKCPGREKKRCDHGWCKDGTQCEACGGKGYMIHSTAQEAILLPMPDDPKDMATLENVLIYKGPPIELVKFQNEYTLQLERQTHQAVFNSQVFVKNHYSGDQQTPDVENTATMADYNMDSVYDTLQPFTGAISEVWKDFVTIMAMIAGETRLDKIDLLYSFPADLKLKTSGLLMAERRQAKESGSPAFLLETIDDDMATITYQGDDLALQKYKVKRRYFPFAGKNEEEIAALLGSQYVRKSDKVLYSNFDQIFKELEAENTGFWLLANVKEQAKQVADKVQEFIAALEADEPKFSVDNFQNPASDKSNPDGNTDENPGDDENQDEPAE